MSRACRTLTPVGNGRHQRKRRGNPRLLSETLLLRQTGRVLRLEILEDRSLLSVDLGLQPTALLDNMLGERADTSPRATGLIPPTEQELAWERDHAIVTQEVRLNQLGLERVNAERGLEGLSTLSTAKEPSSALGSEITGITQAQLVAQGAAASAVVASMSFDLPAAVDNSKLPYFPPIRSQGSVGSCTSFATTYYTMTYMTAMARGWDVTNASDNSNKFSPKWSYNMVNGGGDYGSSLQGNYQVLLDHGAATWSDFAYDTNYSEWLYDAPDVWRKALGFRMSQFGYVDAVSGASLSQLKTLLSDGYVLNFGTNIYGWQFATLGNDPSVAGDDAFVGQNVASWVTNVPSSHAMTIVGYNDDLWVDINNNGAVDPGENGALKIANSWGDSWENGGFVWLAYDALKAQSAVSGGPSANRQSAFFGDQAFWLTAQVGYIPTVLAEFSVRHAARNELEMSVGTGSAGAAAPGATWKGAGLTGDGGSVGFDGLSYATNPGAAPVGTFVLDYSNLAPQINVSTRYFVGLNDTANTSLSGQLLSFRLLDSAGNELAICPPATFPITDAGDPATVQHASIDFGVPAQVGVKIVQSDAATSVKKGMGGDVYSVFLTSQPSADVVVTVHTDSQVTVSPTVLTFTSQTWNLPQTVTVRAVNDGIVEGPHSSTITQSVASGDTAYNGIAVPSVAVSITYAQGEIQGRVWCDFDADGVRDPVDPAVVGYTVFLDANRNGILDTGEVSTSTDYEGAYIFRDLAAGTYLVQVRWPVDASWQPTNPLGGNNVVLASGQVVHSVDFGARYTKPLEVTVWAEDCAASEPNDSGLFSVGVGHGLTYGLPFSLSINVEVTGTATRGTDYQLSGGNTLVTQANWNPQVSCRLDVLNDASTEGLEYVTLRVLPGNGYQVSSPSQDTIYIVDDEGGPRRIYVDADATGSHNGASWHDAYTDLRAALLAAASGDELWVAEGTYRPGPSRYDYFPMKQKLAVYGGFAGIETTRDQRDWVSHPTVLSGDIGVQGDDSDNCYNVVSMWAVGGEAVLDGFTVADANSDPWRCMEEGAISVTGASSPVLRNLTLANNHAESGGAIYFNGCSVENEPLIDNCVFLSNSASLRGGAVCMIWEAAPRFRDCIFVGNSAPSGGAVYSYHMPLELTNCVFVNNTADDSGGGVYTSDSSLPVVTNCTFVGNHASKKGGAIYHQDSSLTVVNSLLWGNVDAGGSDESSQIHIESGSAAVSYSCIQGWLGGLGGVGNTGADPRLYDVGDPAGADGRFFTLDDGLTLCPGSPCLDAADGDAAPAADLLGNSRYDRPGTPNTGCGSPPYADIGAYELQASLLPPRLYVTISPTAVYEDAGPAAATLTIARYVEDLSEPLTVLLTSSDTTEAVLPVATVIPAEQTSVTVPIDAVDDTQCDGIQVATITASAAGYFAGSRTLEILNREVYYVNDSSTVNDAWCTAPGNDANDGCSPATPKATIQTLLAAYPLGPGDTVYIDTGSYTLASDIQVPATCSGDATAPVTFAASPYGVTLNRNSTAYPAKAWDIAASYVTLTTAASNKYPALPQSYVKIVSGYYGVNVVGASVSVARCEVYNSYYGIYVSGSGAQHATITNSLIHDTSDTGVCVYNAGNATIQNCTLAGSGSMQVYFFQSAGSVLTNNIIAVGGSYGIGRFGYLSDVTSDYNDIYLQGVGSCVADYYDPASSTLCVAASLADWRRGTGQDEHSLSAAPLFVNSAGGDYHVRSTAGSYHGGAWSADASTSPSIDAGLGDAGAELAPNATPLYAAGAGMRDLGAYGGTEQSSRTPTGRVLCLLTPVGGASYGTSPLNVSWTWVGQGWQSGDTVTLQSSADSGTTWNSFAAGLPVQDRGYAWDISAYPSRPSYRLKETCDQDPAATAQTGSNFGIRIAAAAYTFYVNDSSTVNDAWCTAPGNDANDGCSPATPKATIQTLLAAYPLGPGDTVYIDTGSYTLASDIQVPATCSGDATAPVTFAASPYGVTLNRNSTAYPAKAWDIAASYVTLTTAASNKYPALPQSYVKIVSGYYGVNVVGDSVSIARCEVYNSCYGIYVSADDVTITNSLILNTTVTGVCVWYTNNATIQNCTLAGSGSAQVHFVSSTGNVLTNNIIAVGGSYGINLNGFSSITSDYNDIYLQGLASYVANYRDPASSKYCVAASLADWRKGSGQDQHSLSRNPLFVNAAGGDYHVQSTAGSYHNGVWTADAADSCTIDAGYGDAGTETTPNVSPLQGANRGMRNLGAYGGTEQSSHTHAGRRLWLYEPLGGEGYATSTQQVCWTWSGQGWQPGDTVKLDSSPDAGATWTAVPGAAAAAVESGVFSWDTSAYACRPTYRLRLTSNQDPTAASQSASDFHLRRNGPFTYYVNDSSTANDAWCTAVGSDANDGLAPAVPMATVQALLARYDLQPGDVVRIDTGTYLLASNIKVTPEDAGDTTARLTFESSPYGVTFDRASTALGSYGWEISSWYVTLTTASSTARPSAFQSWMKVTRAYAGIYSSGQYVDLIACDCSANSWSGIYVYGHNATIRNCVARGSSSASDGSGIFLDYVYGTLVENCTVYGNAKYALRARNSSSTLKNNVIVATGSAAYALYLEYSASTVSDYNDLLAIGGAKLAYKSSDLATLADWQAATGQDAHSLSVDPRFANPAGGDFHLRSNGGRYDPSRGLPPEDAAGWVIDSSTSPGIDRADPTAAYANEPLPNGARRNLGAYGNTLQASKQDAIAPTATVVPVSPDPRATAVENITISFSEQVSGLDLADLSLTRGGGANLLTVSQTLTTNDNITWVLGNLSSLTGAPGAYTLTLLAAGSGIQDTVGNPLAVDASDGWIVKLNNAPTGTDVTKTMLEDGTYTLAAADFGFSDPLDSPANNFLAVKITTLATAGSVKLNGTAVTAGQFVSVADITANKLVFTPVANTSGSPYATFTFQVQDDGGTVSGGVDLAQSPNTMTINVQSGCNLDVDGNGQADALTDGILFLRYLFDPAGAWNYSDALGSGATRTTRTAIKTFLDGGRTTVLDVDGNGAPDALTDGILILRYLFDPAGAWNYSDALGSGATRTTRTAIKAYLDQCNPGLAPASGLVAAGLAENPVVQIDVNSTIDGSDPTPIQTVADPSPAAVDGADSSGCAVVLVQAQVECTIQNSPVLMAIGNDNALISGVARAVLLGRAREEVLFPIAATHKESTERANTRAQDTVLQDWKPTRGYEIPTAMRVACANHRAFNDDEILEELYGDDRLDWFQRRPNDSFIQRQMDELLASM